MILMPAGLAIVLTHNVWVADWPVIITLLGWLAVISGAVRIFAPHRVNELGKKVLTSQFHHASPRRSGSSSAARSATSVFRYGSQ